MVPESPPLDPFRGDFVEDAVPPASLGVSVKTQKKQEQSSALGIEMANSNVEVACLFYRVGISGYGYGYVLQAGGSFSKCIG